ANLARSRAALDALRRIRRQPLSFEDQQTAAILEWDLERDLDLAPYHWMSFPLGPYTSLIRVLQFALPAIPVAEESDRQHYRALLGEVPAFLGQIGEKLRGQMRRGLLVHREA